MFIKGKLFILAKLKTFNTTVELTPPLFENKFI